MLTEPPWNFFMNAIIEAGINYISKVWLVNTISVRLASFEALGCVPGEPKPDDSGMTDEEMKEHKIVGVYLPTSIQMSRALVERIMMEPIRYITDPKEYQKQLRHIMEENPDMSLMEFAHQINKSVAWILGRLWS